MRDNGLTASAYTSMGGIDPLVAEPVLTALAEAGIAAYAVAPGEPGPSEPGDGVSPDSPTSEQSSSEENAEAVPQAKAEAKAEAPAKAEIAAGFEEMFVDADSMDRARSVIERSTEDAEWQSLVEQFNAPSAPGHAESPVPRWPASEDVDENSYEPLIDVPAGLIVGDGPDGDEEDENPPPKRADDPHDHYVPPEPPPGPRLDWISRAAWLGLIGGPVLLILAAILNFDTSGRIMLIAVVGFIAGFLTLVIRMKDRLPPDDTPDDGAVV